MKTETVEVLPPNNNDAENMAKLLKIIEPIANKYFENELDKEKELTRRLEIETNAKREESKENSEHRKLGDGRDFMIVMAALLTFVTTLIFGMYKTDGAIIQNAIVGLGTFFGGFGLGRNSRQQSN
jgi:hypothetical protein